MQSDASRLLSDCTRQAPQELHLLPFSTWGEFCSWLFGTVYYEPLIGAVQEVTGAANAVDVVATWAEEMSVRDVYAKLQEHSWPALMVDKSPMNADHQNFLRIAARGWKRSFFVHLFRHPTPGAIRPCLKRHTPCLKRHKPCLKRRTLSEAPRTLSNRIRLVFSCIPAIHSTVYLRKGVSLVQGFKHEVTDQELFCSAEVTWFEANRNIKDVLSEEVPSSMRTAVNYEQFVVSPEVLSDAHFGCCLMASGCCLVASGSCLMTSSCCPMVSSCCLMTPQCCLVPQVTLRALCSTLCIDWEPQMYVACDPISVVPYERASSFQLTVRAVCAIVPGSIPTRQRQPKHSRRQQQYLWVTRSSSNGHQLMQVKQTSGNGLHFLALCQ